MRENRKAQSGRSMIEMLGVLGIIGVMSVGVLAGYGLAMDKYETSVASEAVYNIVDETKTLFSIQADYTNLTTTRAAEIIEDNIDKAPFGGITLAKSSDNDSFEVEITEVTDSACERLATSRWGNDSSGFVSLTINDTVVLLDIATVSVAHSSCNTNDTNSLKWTFE